MGIKRRSNGKEDGLRVAHVVSEVLDFMFGRRGTFWVFAVLIDLAFLSKIIVEKKVPLLGVSSNKNPSNHAWFLCE